MAENTYVHWVGEHNNTVHGNGAGSRGMERTSGDEDEVTCPLCHNLLARMARDDDRPVSGDVGAEVAAAVEELAELRELLASYMEAEGATGGEIAARLHLSHVARIVADAERRAAGHDMPHEAPNDTRREPTPSDSNPTPSTLTPKERQQLAAALVINWPMPTRVDDMAPIVEPLIAERVEVAKAEALREAAHEIRQSVMPEHPNAGYRDGHEHAAWVAETLIGPRA